ncbi:hypothetical protein [Ideonella dechloratans]|uniref:hypothetical protein n=1 Tax=Ideonella dechloratans TaxID=36863 RepID=UPI0035B1E68F
MRLPNAKVLARGLGVWWLGLALGAAQAAPAQPDPAVLAFLMDKATQEFSQPGPMHPKRIKTARLGHLHDAQGRDLDLLCGRFVPTDPSGGKAEVPFATLKTGDYEQWLGGQAVGLCSQPTITWFKGDHAQALMQRLRAAASAPQP